MKTKQLIMMFIITLLSITSLTAQDNVPPALIKALPDKYNVIYDMYYNAGNLTNIEIQMESKLKYGCGNNEEWWKPIQIYIGISINKDDKIVKSQENAKPFSNYFPTIDSHKPQIDPNDKFIKYSETNIIDVPEGKAVYYTWQTKCEDNNKNEKHGVSLLSIFGSYAMNVSITIDGDIDSSEAISILKELHTVLSHFDFKSL